MHSKVFNLYKDFEPLFPANILTFINFGIPIKAVSDGLNYMIKTLPTSPYPRLYLLPLIYTIAISEMHRYVIFFLLTIPFIYFYLGKAIGTMKINLILTFPILLYLNDLFLIALFFLANVIVSFSMFMYESNMGIVEFFKYMMFIIKREKDSTYAVEITLDTGKLIERSYKLYKENGTIVLVPDVMNLIILFNGCITMCYGSLNTNSIILRTETGAYVDLRYSNDYKMTEKGNISFLNYIKIYSPETIKVIKQKDITYKDLVLPPYNSTTNKLTNIETIYPSIPYKTNFTIFDLFNLQNMYKMACQMNQVNNLEKVKKNNITLEDEDLL